MGNTSTTSITTRAPLVVVVDDSADLLNALSFSLQTQGFRAETFTSAEAAESWAHLGEAAACLVIDQNLPGASGLALLARMRSAGCEAPAILITTNPPRAVLGLAARMNTPVVEKPLLDDRLFAQIRASMTQSAGR